MKIKLCIVALVLSLFSISCSTAGYYQLYKATGTKELKTNDNGIEYEDTNCKVTYNLWSDTGDAGFIFYNKTNENIYLNLSDSYFILNGIAYDYFKNREFTNASSHSYTVDKNTVIGSPITTNNIFGPVIGLQSSNKGIAQSSGSSVTIIENKIVTIPPQTAKVISEYHINLSRIKNCNLLKYPSKKQVRPVSFSIENTPLAFSNKIAYNVGTGGTIRFENSFYISEISNHPKEEFTSTKKDKECGENVYIRVFNYASPDKFYLGYSRGTDASKY